MALSELWKGTGNEILLHALGFVLLLLGGTLLLDFLQAWITTTIQIDPAYIGLGLLLLGSYVVLRKT